jgi:hypothetical protein
MIKKNKLWASTVIVCFALSGLGFWWLKMPYAQPVPRQVAIQFITHLENKQFQQAHAMTFKNSLVGKTAEDLKRISERELCANGGHILTYTFPLQTNGNRLRRLMNGTEVEMPKVHVDFKCMSTNASDSRLIGVKLQHTGAGQWKVISFSAHAG